MRWLLVFISCCLAFAGQAQETFSGRLSCSHQKQFSAAKHAEAISGAGDNFHVHHYRCNWKLDPAVRWIEGAVKISFRTLAQSDSIVLDLTDKLMVDSVLFDQQKISFTQRSNKTLSLYFPSTIPQNSYAAATVFYHGEPDISAFGSFITTLHNSTPVLWTLSEPFGSRDWWPCKNNVGEKADSIDITIQYPAQYTASSNGLLFSESEANGFKTSHFKHRYPIASYLVAVAITNYSVIYDSVTMGQKRFALLHYVYPEDLAVWQAQAPAVKNAFTNFYNWMGDYPFDKEKYAQTQFSWGGGMEHQTNSFISGTDEYLMAHELAHQWFGDKLSISDWRHLWLNEGFATFFGLLNFKVTNRPWYDYLMKVQRDNVIAEPGGSVWVDDVSDVNRLFNGRLTYDKGACFIRMLNILLGDEKFFKLIKDYTNHLSFAYKSIATEDFQQLAEKYYGGPLDFFFDQWIKKEGYPTYHINWYQNRNHWAKIKVHQTTSHPSVTYFKTAVPLTFKSFGNTFSTTAFFSKQDDEIWINVGFAADTLIIDEAYLTLSGSNTSKKTGYPAGASAVRIFPVPAQDVLNVEIKNPATQSYSVYVVNAEGRTLLQKELSADGYDQIFQIPVQSLAKGWYYIRVSNSKEVLLQQSFLRH